MKQLILLALVVLLSLPVGAQPLRPGFEKSEYTELIKINFRFVDSVRYEEFPAPERFTHAYRSPILGIDNCWDFWKDKQGTGVISVRGTTGTIASWMGNFYSAMVPATGWLKTTEADTFRYALSEDPKAAVHVGWLISTGALMKDMLPQLETFLAAGNRDLLITGHSQGGGIAFLVTAHLRSLQRQGKLPADLRIKTYCSAGPKPGNLYFAYSYEAMTQMGWGYNVVNAADWVPETPFSIQTTNDFNTTNPFTGAKKGMKVIPIPVRWVVKSAYRKMDRPTRRSQRRFEKYLGRKMDKYLARFIKGIEAPEYLPSSAYVRCGNHITLVPDAAYYEQFPDSSSNKFIHHGIHPYLYLVERLKTD